MVILHTEIRETECADISTAKAGLGEVSDIWLEGIRDVGNHVTMHKTRTIKITQHKLSAVPVQELCCELLICMFMFNYD